MHHAPHLSAAPISLAAEHPRPHIRLLRVTGELDLDTAPHLRAAALQAPPAGIRDLVVDLGAVTFLGSAGLRALLDCRKSLRTVVLVNADHSAVARPLTLTGLDDLFPRLSSAATALAALP